MTPEQGDNLLSAHSALQERVTKLEAKNATQRQALDACMLFIRIAREALKSQPTDESLAQGAGPRAAAGKDTTLTPEEVAEIQSWYQSALGESATDSSEAERSLIRKLGLHGDWDDQGGKYCSWCGCDIADELHETGCVCS